MCIPPVYCELNLSKTSETIKKNTQTNTRLLTFRLNLTVRRSIFHILQQTGFGSVAFLQGTRRLTRNQFCSSSHEDVKHTSNRAGSADIAVEL